MLPLLLFQWSGFVRKSGMMKIVHEKYKSARKFVDPVISEFQASFGSAIEYNKELDTFVNKAQVTRRLILVLCRDPISLARSASWIKILINWFCY